MRLAQSQQDAKSLNTNIADDIIKSLMQSLHRDEILENFSYTLRQHLKFSYLKFTDENHIDIFNYGKKCKYQISYTLSSEGMPALGTLSIGRASKFSQNEISLIEDILSLVILTLKNAKTHQQALDSARIDPLTQLLNRYSLNEQLDREIDRAKRNKHNLSILMADLDNFKKINDTFGHHNGDRILVHTGQILRKSARGVDLIFRLGGEEFLLILNNTNQKGALKLANRIVNNVAAENINIDKKPVRYTISVGAAHLAKNDDKKSLLIRADKALYTAKHQGRNQVKDERTPSLSKTEKAS